jgi:hypothetical protein
MDEEVNKIFQVRTTTKIVYCLGCKNIVREYYFLLIRSQKYSGEYINFFYNHLKSIRKNKMGGKDKIRHVCMAKRQNP